jgi:hypothetical protein
MSESSFLFGPLRSTPRSAFSKGFELAPFTDRHSDFDLWSITAVATPHRPGATKLAETLARFLCGAKKLTFCEHCAPGR